ncbi:hypothetical protein BDP27DRAFT_1363140 [Rhodocollybia butyracea]|uniref:Uncharacterized protein n=1 Tax=Rhodocollybia butyracea TaxID=206335 RepID=A0A9P5PXD7_9AGAR|nr:hypothetical protein BDP27DRAFT_1363140 [Rhodocollybia butyracea]
MGFYNIAGLKDHSNTSTYTTLEVHVVGAVSYELVIKGMNSGDPITLMNLQICFIGPKAFDSPDNWARHWADVTLSSSHVVLRENPMASQTSSCASTSQPDMTLEANCEIRRLRIMGARLVVELEENQFWIPVNSDSVIYSVPKSSIHKITSLIPSFSIWFKISWDIGVDESEIQQSWDRFQGRELEKREHCLNEVILATKPNR